MRKVVKSSKKRINYSDDDDDEAPDEDLECLSYNRSCQQQLLSESFYFDGLVMALMMVFTHGAAFSDRSRCTCPPVWPIKVWGLGGSDGCCRSSALSSQPASLTGWGLGEGLIKAEPSAPSGGAGVRRQVMLDLLWRLFQRESVFKHKTAAGRDSLKHSEVSEARGVESRLMLTASVKRVTELKNVSLSLYRFLLLIGLE